MLRAKQPTGQLSSSSRNSSRLCSEWQMSAQVESFPWRPAHALLDIQSHGHSHPSFVDLFDDLFPRMRWWERANDAKEELPPAVTLLAAFAHSRPQLEVLQQEVMDNLPRRSLIIEVESGCCDDALQELATASASNAFRSPLACQRRQTTTARQIADHSSVIDHGS
eukprot:s159_g13.t1